uniref:CXXC motif containing zinc binding protein n=1 Tax=Poecilia latipinna TaxID=48699 RepID=A0A3B3U916_9TELE
MGANLENVTNVRPLGEDFRWFLKLKCGNCGEVPDKWQYVTLMESVPLKGGRGSASMVQKCKLCARENSIGVHKWVIKCASDNEKFKTMVQFECRGLEPIDFQPQDWNDYDDKAKECVGIYEVTHRFIKC